MHANHDLETIDLALLEHINGGAGNWRDDVVSWFKDRYRDLARVITPPPYVPNGKQSGSS
jgi:hypothetical protein